MPPCVFSVVRKSIILARHSVKIKKQSFLDSCPRESVGGLSSIPSRERIRSTLLGSIHTVGRAILQFLRREGMWKELEVVGYSANRMQCSHVHGGFLQGFGTPLAFCLWEVLVCVGGIS